MNASPITLSRNVKNFNFGWKFLKGDAVDAHQFDFSDDNWRKIDLPHDWSVEGPFDSKWASGTGYLPAGIGWYRKHFTLAKNNEGKKVFIYFEGVYNNSEVWINGVSLGKRPNGYISFHYDMSEHIRFGSDNIIAVKVDHTKYADSRWYTGSGIYRNVKLIVTETLYINPWGVYARANVKGNDRGILEIEVSVLNDTTTDSKVNVLNELLHDGKIVGQTEETAIVKTNSEAKVRGIIKVINPNLWDVESPELYSLVSSIKDEEKVLDRVETNIGFRKIHFDSNTGFFLNGKSMKLKGICMHHDAGSLGAAVPIDVLDRRLDIVKQMGCNAIRTSHNPFSPEFYELCDKKGFLVINEAFDEWELPKNKWVEGWNLGTPSKDGYAENFEQCGKIDLRDQVLRDRNHPCIIMWSIGNEIDYPNDPYSHKILNSEKNPQTNAKFDEKLPDANRLGEIAKELVDIVKQYDTERPVTAGLASVLMSNEIEYADALDVAGYNYQEYRYKDDHIRYPERIIYGSENSIAFKAWQEVAENRYVMGQFLWTGLEFLGEARKHPVRNSKSGVIDLAGNPKPEYFYRQSLWSDKPMVFIGVSKPGKDQKYFWTHHTVFPHWNWNPNQKLQATIFSNCQEVELYLNDKSLGVKRLVDSTEHKLSWIIYFEPGELRVIARNNKIDVAWYKLKTAGEPTKLIANSDLMKLKANNQDVAHIEVVIADENDIPVYSANNRIECQIVGPIRLLGMEDANAENIENYKDSKQNAFMGRLLVYIQALDQVGRGKIILSSPGIKNCELVIDVVSINEIER